MNERFDKLIEQCTTQNFSDCTGAFETFDKEKFAELIAKEQIKNCRDMFIVGSVSWNLLNEKLEHFGVEE